MEDRFHRGWEDVGQDNGEKAVHSHGQEAVGARLAFAFLGTVGAQPWDGADDAEDGSSPMS